MIDEVPLRDNDLVEYSMELYDYLKERPSVTRLLTWRNLERPEASDVERDAYLRKITVVAQAQKTLAPGSVYRPGDVLVLILGLVQAWSNASPALRDLVGADDPAREDRRRGTLREAVRRLVTPRERSVDDPDEKGGGPAMTPQGG